MWSADQLLKQLYKEEVNDRPKVFNDQWKVDTRRKFEAALGHFPRPAEPPKAKELERKDMGSYQRLRIELTTFSSVKMPVYVLIPKQKKQDKLPAVLAIHGHGYGHKEIVGLNPDGSPRKDETYHKNMGIDLVEKGVVVVVPELIGFGDRKLKEHQGVGEPTDNSCYRIATQLLLYGKTLAGLRIAECRRVLDYMETMEEVDSSKIGTMGISGGGLVAGFTSALDERLKATVISGYTNTFKGSIIARRHCLDNYIPGILHIAEMPELIGLIAPRALFIEAGDKDHLFPIQDVQIALKQLRNIYISFQAERLLAHAIFPGGHEISGEKAYPWLLEHLEE